MDLDRLYGGSYINWAGVAESCAKRTVSSRMLIFAARSYLERDERTFIEDREKSLPPGFPKEVIRAYSTPPEDDDGSVGWGEFLDAALAAEFEMLPYGERPPVISELRAGFLAAASEAGEETKRGRWFLERKARLPGSDLADGSGYLPV